MVCRSILLTGCLCVGLMMAGCGKKEEKPAPKKPKAEPTKAAPAEAKAEPAKPEPVPAEAPEPEPAPAKAAPPKPAEPKPAAPKPAPAKAEEPTVKHPLADAKVGEWCMFQTMGGGKMKQTVTQVTPDEVTLKTEIYMAGQDKPVTTTEMKVPLKAKAEDAEKAKAQAAKMKDLGKETVTVGGKRVTCDVKQVEQPGMVIKTWTCADVPINGVVKSVMIRGGKETVTMMLLDFGRP